MSDWHLVEQHGAWWAYKGELPPPEAFRSHGRLPNPQIIGPFPSRVAGEALLPRYLGRRP